jgi:hypothetical protein
LADQEDMGLGWKKIWWLGVGVLTACGTSAALPAKKENATISSPFYVVQYYPAEGATLPAAVEVAFNKPELNRATLAAVTHYNLVCGGITHAASSVNAVNGYSSVTVNLPTISGLASGSSCTLWLSLNLQDAEGNPLGDPRSVTYVVP